MAYGFEGVAAYEPDDWDSDSDQESNKREEEQDDKISYNTQRSVLCGTTLDDPKKVNFLGKVATLHHTENG